MGAPVSAVEDWIAIYELRSAYGWHYDSPDLDALVGLFTDTAACEFGPYGRWEGIDAIRPDSRPTSALRTTTSLRSTLSPIR